MNKGNKGDSFIKGTMILAAAGILIKIMGAFFRIPLGNMIGSVGMGYYQTAYPLYALFLTLATAGFPTAVAKLVSEKVAIGDERGAYNVFKVSHIVLFLTGVVMFILLFFGSNFIATNIQNNPNAVYTMRAIAPALLVVPSMSVYRGYYQGKKQMSKIAISQMVEQAFRVVLGLTLAYVLMKSFGAVYGSAGAIAGATIGSIASMLFLLIVYIKDSKERNELIAASEHFEEESFGTILSNLLWVAIPISIGAAVMPFVNMVDTAIVINRLMVAGFTRTMGNSLLGQMSGMAMAIVNLPMVLTTAMGMSLVPSISQSYALHDMVSARKDAYTALKITILLVLPCAFGLAALSGPIMNLLYPKEGHTLAVLLFTLSPGAIFLGMLYSMNGILQGMGKPFVPVFALICGIVAKIVLSYTLTAIPSINILGSAIGTVASYMIAAAIELSYIIKHMKLKVNISDFLTKPVFTVVVMYVCVKLGYMGVSQIINPKLATLVSIIIGGISYLLVLLSVGGISKVEMLSMPKGEKIYKGLKKLKLVRY